MLTLGYKASAEQFGPRPLLDLAIEAERDGFDSVFVAQSMATIGCLAEGRRVVLGVGTGESMNEYPILMAGWPDQKEPPRPAEGIERGGPGPLGGEDVNYQGEVYRTRGATIYDKRLSRSGSRSRSLGRPPPGRTRRRRLHLHLGQAPRALHRDAPAVGRPGRRRPAGRPTRSRG